MDRTDRRDSMGAVTARLELLDAREIAGRLDELVNRLVRALRQTTVGPFSPTQLSVLGVIHRRGPIALSDLAAVERLSLPTISRVVALLESHGLIRRKVDPTDRRVSFVAISAEGRERIAAEIDRRSLWLASELGRLDPEAFAAVAAAVAALESLAIIDR